MCDRGRSSDDEESFHSASEGEQDSDSENEQPLQTARSVAEPEDLAADSIIVEPAPNEHRENQFESTSKTVEEIIENDTKPNTDETTKCEQNDIQVEPEITKPEPELASNTSETKVESGWDDWDDDFDPADLVTPEEEFAPWPSGDRVEDETSTSHISHSNSRESDQMERPTTLWDWNSLWSAASDSLNTLTSSVGEGFTAVIETVETGLGAPTPQDLARMSMEERLELRRKVEQLKEPWPRTDKDDCDSAAEEAASDGGSEPGGVKSEQASSGYQSDGARSRDFDPSVAAPDAATSGPTFSDFFSGVTNTGKTLVTGSLDVLESLGKKTFETLTVAEQIQGEKQRRRFILTQEKPNLSNVLRELKTKGESDARLREEEEESRRSNFAYLFDRYDGMVHLEGLEMLSENCSRQVEPQISNVDYLSQSKIDAANEVFETMNEHESFSEDGDQDFQLLVQVELSRLGLAYNCGKLFQVQSKYCQWLDECISEQDSGQRKAAKELHVRGIECMAEMTARSVESMHKLGQLLLVAPNKAPNAASPFANLTSVLCAELGILSAKFSRCLNTAADDSENPDEVSPMLTNLFLEANNSANYIVQSFHLLKPVVQLVIVQQSNN